MVAISDQSNTCSSLSIDPTSGFDFQTKIYHSLRPHTPLPDETIPLSVADFIFTLFRKRPTSSAFLLDATTRRHIPFSQLQFYTTNLAHSLQRRTGLSKGDTAFVLCPNSVHVPLLYLSLFSLGVIVSPSNPASSIPEISRQVHISKPVIAFATSDTAPKLPSLKHPPILLDSPEFHSFMTTPTQESGSQVAVAQSDTAAILYSSGTTGEVKGVALTHRNLISVLIGANVNCQARPPPAVLLCAVPYFHVYGLTCSIKTVAMGDSLISMKRFDLGLMLRSIQEFRVSQVALVPPVVVAMVSNALEGYDLSYLQVIFSGGAPLTNAIIDKFNSLFPNVLLLQAYGMTETSGGIARTVGPYEKNGESKKLGATGRLVSNCQAKIVDPESGIGLPPFKHGELWVRGPTIMKGYVQNEEGANSDGWLRTGDICYFDDEGFLYFVERLKELIKCNGYQVPPTELEHLLQSHPDIVDAAVVPYPDEKAGQVPIAFVVRRPGSTIDESVIKDFVAGQVAPYKKLRSVSFIDSIPKNAPGKVLRKELIKIALSSAASKL